MVLPPTENSHAGIGFASVKPRYESYQSPYGPQYKLQRNIRGIGPKGALRLSATLAAFGVAGGAFALQFLSEVPKIRNDICAKLPVVGDYFVRETPPSDNPF